MATDKKDLGFAPHDLRDGRQLLDWKSRYSDDAGGHIMIDAIYCGGSIVLPAIATLILWSGQPMKWFDITPEKYSQIVRYGCAWFGGTLGGALFSTKWLYHSVAKQIWHMDRRLWRFFTPHLAAGYALGITALLSSGIVRLFDQSSLRQPGMVFGFSFLVGLFSDSAIAKLNEIANTIFGTTKSGNHSGDGQNKHLDSPVHEETTDSP